MNLECFKDYFGGFFFEIFSCTSFKDIISPCIMKIANPYHELRSYAKALCKL